MRCARTYRMSHIYSQPCLSIELRSIENNHWWIQAATTNRRTSNKKWWLCLKWATAKSSTKLIQHHRLHMRMWSSKVINIQRLIRGSRCQHQVSLDKANQNVCYSELWAKFLMTIDDWRISLLPVHLRRPKLGRKPVQSVCHLCGMQNMTTVEYRTSFITHATAATIVCIGLVGNQLKKNWTISCLIILSRPRQTMASRLVPICIRSMQNSQPLLPPMLCVHRQGMNRSSQPYIPSNWWLRFLFCTLIW